MANIKKRTVTKYWLILLCISLLLSASLAVTETQARYSNTAVWNTVLHYEPGAISSNCLSREEQVILLGELPEAGREIKFTLQAASQTAEKLTWLCDAEKYLQVTMQVKQNGTAKEIQQGDTLRLKENMAAEVIMTLTPTEGMLSQPHAAVEANITVEFGDLSGIFRTTLAAVAEETTEPTEPEETTIPTEPETTTDPTEPEETEPPTESGTTPPTETEGTSEPSESETTSDPAEPTDTSSEPEETTTATETGSGETIEAPISASNEPADTLNAEPAGDATQPETEKTSRSVSESQGNENVHPGGALTLALKVIQSFDPTQGLPLLIEKPADIPCVQLGLALEGEKLRLKDFPAFTRYTWEGISYLLYDGGIIEIQTKSQDEIPLLLYFADAGIQKSAELRIGALALKEDAVAETALAVTKANADLSELETPRILTDTLQKTAGGAAAEDSTTFTLELPPEWVDLGVTVEYTVEMLCAEESGPVYQLVDLEAETVMVEYVQEQANHSLTLSLGQTRPPAGTYRLTVRFYYLDICFQELETAFWIQYTA